MIIDTSYYPALAQFINDEWRGSTGRAGLEVRNPASGETLTVMPIADTLHVEQALQAAASAQQAWCTTPVQERAAYLHAAARLLRERAQRIGAVLTLEQGRPFRQAVDEVERAAAIIDWNALAAVDLMTSQAPANSPIALSRFVPVGPVAAFTPWNVPALSPARKISMALSTGCVCILKPAEDTPGTAVELVRAFADAGLPPGVLNLLLGDPAQISDMLIRSPVIRKITFTGSVPVGKHLAAVAGSLMKPVTMELGGHNPVLILDDVDVRQVAAQAATAAFRNVGQICSSPKRFYVQQAAYPLFLEAFACAAASLKMGEGFDPNSQMGPIINQRRLDAISQLVDDTVRQGARVVTGGSRTGSSGYFYPPTILTDIPVDSVFMREEPFGPVAGVFSFDDVHEGVAACNQSALGLAAYVFSACIDTARSLAWDMEAGVIGINQFSISRPEVPFGGVKDSGYGREGGLEGLRAFLTTRTIV